MIDAILGTFPFKILDSLIYVLGVYTLYLMIRFRSNGKGFVDQTAGMLSFLFVMWTCTTQTKLVAKTMKFVTQDLTEWLRFRKDDNEIS